MPQAPALRCRALFTPLIDDDPKRYTQCSPKGYTGSTTQQKEGGAFSFEVNNPMGFRSFFTDRFVSTPESFQSFFTNLSKAIIASSVAFIVIIRQDRSLPTRAPLHSLYLTPSYYLQIENRLMHHLNHRKEWTDSNTSVDSQKPIHLIRRQKTESNVADQMHIL